MVNESYIREKENWINFPWDNKPMMLKLGKARNLQEKHLGKMESLDIDLQNEAVLNTFTLDVLRTSEIEDEFDGKLTTSK